MSNVFLVVILVITPSKILDLVVGSTCNRSFEVLIPSYYFTFDKQPLHCHLCQF